RRGGVVGRGRPQTKIFCGPATRNHGWRLTACACLLPPGNRIPAQHRHFLRQPAMTMQISSTGTIANPSTPGARPLVRLPGAAPATSVQKPGVARTRLLLEGPIVSTLLRLAAPNLVVNVVLIAVTPGVDAYFLRPLGWNALAGLALVFPLMMLMQQMANSSMGGALASAIARAIGAGRREDAAALIVHGLVIAFGMAALFTSVFLAAGPSFY